MPQSVGDKSQVIRGQGEVSNEWAVDHLVLTELVPSCVCPKVCPKVIPPSLQSCPLLASLPRVIGLTYLFWLLWYVPSRPTFLMATCPGHKQPDQSPEPWTSFRVPPEPCGLRLHPTVPRHSARMGWVCASLWLLHKQMQHGGAPGTEKGTCGRRDLGKHVTYCTRVAPPCLGTYNITAMNTRICSKHATLRGYVCCFYIPIACYTHVAPVSFYTYRIFKAHGKSSMHSGPERMSMHMCSICMHPARQYCSAHAGHLYAYVKFSAPSGTCMHRDTQYALHIGEGEKTF